MSTTAAQALAVIRARLEAYPPLHNGVAVEQRWEGEDGPPLSDTPTPFIYTVFVTDPGAIVGFGGGRGQNLYRNTAQIAGYVFYPHGWGLRDGLLIAEQYAALFRSYRDDYISCFDATVMASSEGSAMKPPGEDSEADNYRGTGALISLHYDQIG